MNDSFVSARGLARWTAGLLIAQAVAGLAALFSNLNQLLMIKDAIAGRFPSLEQANTVDAVAKVINWTDTAFLLASAVLFLLWIYRAHRNLPALGAAGLEHTPGWAVGSFFVPVVNLFRPFQVMREIWKASDPTIPEGDPNAWAMMESTPVLGWWWACWLLRNLPLSVSRTLMGSAHRPQDLLTPFYWNTAGQVINLAGLVLIIRLVLTIDRRQAELHEKVLKWEWQTIPTQP